MDSEAEFRRLYEANRAAVHAYFTGRTGSPQQAADLMQDVFLRVWRRLEELTGLPEDRQRAWIFTVARNLSVDAHRHEQTRASTEQVLAWEPVRQQQSASTAVIAAERVAVVGEAIRRLPEPQRVVITMAAAGGMTSAELADVLGVPAGTVRYRLSLARRAVAQALARYDEPAEE
jgi:RNA polymerase sigma-70 factor, ECF subfamily